MKLFWGERKHQLVVPGVGKVAPLTIIEINDADVAAELCRRYKGRLVSVDSPEHKAMMKSVDKGTLVLPKDMTKDVKDEDIIRKRRG